MHVNCNIFIFIIHDDEIINPIAKEKLRINKL